MLTVEKKDQIQCKPSKPQPQNVSVYAHAFVNSLSVVMKLCNAHKVMQSIKSFLRFKKNWSNLNY